MWLFNKQAMRVVVKTYKYLGVILTSSFSLE